MTRIALWAVSPLLPLFFAASVSAESPPTTSPAADATPSTLQQEIAQLRTLQKKVQSELLTPSPEDQQEFADFLKTPDTGLIKILPRGDHPELGLNGGGAYYSFLLKTNEYGHGSDIELQNHRLTCGFAGGDYGYFLPLGDIPIKHAAFVTADAVPEWLDADAAKRWNDFWNTAPVSSDEIRKKEFDAIRAAMKAGIKPKIPERGIPETPKNTYLLRSVAPYRYDILAAFRIEKQFDDGSLLISWKLLKKFPVEDPRRPPIPAQKRRPANPPPKPPQPKPTIIG